MAVATDPADARARRKRGGGHGGHGGGYSPPYAAIVVDVNSGAVLHAADADNLRHPASLTKIMTLYLLFERLEAGKLKLDTPLPVSQHAASQAPTKLGLKPGKTIAVEDAIRAIVTKSANDMAAVVAEAIAGSEGEFAKLMTRKARALGMARTVYVNASGLPADDQVTTARDQALLGRAIQERFPRQYRYFATSSFTYRGETMRNHNHLLGRIEGLDGIKTGYTHASGFNLVTSVRRNNRHIVAVVLGGSSAGARDARMRGLIEKHIVAAAARRTAPVIAEAQSGIDASARARMVVASAGDIPVTPVTAPPSAPAKAAAPPPAANSARADTFSTAAISTKPAPGSSDPIKPILVKTIKVKLGSMQTASLAPPLPTIPVMPAREEPTQAQPQSPEVPSGSSSVQPATASQAAPSSPPPASEIQPSPVSAPAAEAEGKVAVASLPANTEPVSPRKVQVHTGWIIQIGAFAAEREAKQRLNAAQSKAKRLLARADAFTEVVVKGDKTLYRARFAGFQKEKAEAACKQLKRNDIPCMTIKN